MDRFKLAKPGSARRLLLLLGLLLVFSGLGTAAPLCVSGNTLAQYIALGGPCSLSAGPIDLLFSFNVAVPFQYTTNAAFALTPADITITTIAAAPGNFAGLTFASTGFNVPSGGTYANVNIAYSVTVDPLGNPLYKLNRAALASTMSLPGLGLIFLAESDTNGGVYNLGMALPDNSGDVVTANFSPRNSVGPSSGLFVTGTGDVDDFTNTFGVTATVNAIPEPGSWALIAGGLILAALFRVRRFTKVLPVVAAAIGASATAQAATLCTDTQAIAFAVSGTTPPPGSILNLATYKAFGTCELHGMLFTLTDFTVSSTGTPVAVPTAGNPNNPASNSGNAVMVAFLQTPGAGVWTLGYEFFALAATTATSTLDMTFTFTVQSPSFYVTNYLGTTLAYPAGTTRAVTITPPGGTLSGLSPSSVLSQPLGTTFAVTDTISLGNSAYVSQVTDQFTEAVPEPVTSTLVGCALIGLAAFARRRTA